MRDVWMRMKAHIVALEEEGEWILNEDGEKDQEMERLKSDIHALEASGASLPLRSGHFMESGIGYSHSQSLSGSCGRWLLDARMDPTRRQSDTKVNSK